MNSMVVVGLPKGGPTVPVSWPCGMWHTLWDFPKAYGLRTDAARGPCVITLKAVRQPHVVCPHLFKIRRAATLTYVTAMVCDRGKFCGGRTIIIGRRKLRPYGRRSKCDLGINEDGLKTD